MDLITLGDQVTMGSPAAAFGLALQALGLDEVRITTEQEIPEVELQWDDQGVTVKLA